MISAPYNMSLGFISQRDSRGRQATGAQDKRTATPTTRSLRVQSPGAIDHDESASRCSCPLAPQRTVVLVA